MTTSYSLTQYGTCYINTVSLSASISATDTGVYSAVLYRFQLPTNIYFVNTLTLTSSLTSLTVNPSTFKVLLITDPDLLATISAGVLPMASIPAAFSTVSGSAESYELATTTVTSSGTISFDLDLSYITRMLTSTLSYENIWNGSLLFWIVASQDSSADLWSITPTLTAYDVIEYTNRDTGSPGINSSRWDRCPKTGLKIPHDEMIVDGYSGLRVHPDHYDDPEPEPMDWGDEGQNDSENS